MLIDKWWNKPCQKLLKDYVETAISALFDKMIFFHNFNTFWPYCYQFKFAFTLSKSESNYIYFWLVSLGTIKVSDHCFQLTCKEQEHLTPKSSSFLIRHTSKLILSSLTLTEWLKRYCLYVRTEERSTNDFSTQ